MTVPDSSPFSSGGSTYFKAEGRCPVRITITKFFENKSDLARCQGQSFAPQNTDGGRMFTLPGAYIRYSI